MSDAQLAELSRRLESLIRTGTVAEVDLTAVRVRVISGGLHTQWLRWLEGRAADTSTWDPPVVGEQVVLLCPSGNPAAGIVLRGLNSDNNPPPSHSASAHVKRYPDGAVISYDHASGALEATGIKTATVEASEKVTVDVPETEITGNVTIGGNLLVKGMATITMLFSFLSGMAGQRGRASKTAVIQGGIETTEDVVAAGISLTGHRHRENGSGGGITDGPQ